MNNDHYSNSFIYSLIKALIYILLVGALMLSYCHWCIQWLKL